MPLLLPLILLLGVAGWLLVKAPPRGEAPSAGIRIASWVTRVFLFLAIGLALFVLILLPLPNKHRLLALAPLLFGGSLVFKALKNSRKPPQPPQPPEPDLERMKRVRQRD
jgi:hypothetical protein